MTSAAIIELFITRLSLFTMAVRLRLAMHGTRHSRTFRLIAIDQRKRRNAKPIETLGVYNPAVTAESPHKTMQWSVDRIKYWLGVGAQPTDSVVKLLTVVGDNCRFGQNLNAEHLSRARSYRLILGGIQSLHYR